MPNLFTVSCIALVSLLGCAGADVRPLVDMRGVNQSA